MCIWYVHVCICVYVYMCICMYMCLCFSVYVYLYMYICICICICISETQYSNITLIRNCFWWWPLIMRTECGDTVTCSMGVKQWSKHIIWVANPKQFASVALDLNLCKETAGNASLWAWSSSFYSFLWEFILQNHPNFQLQLEPFSDAQVPTIMFCLDILCLSATT